MDNNTSFNDTANTIYLNKETLYILLLLVFIFGIALVCNIIFSVLYGCCPNQKTNKQRILLHVLNFGLLLHTGAEVYHKYFEHEMWQMGEYDDLNCKAIRFVTTAGFGCYIYCLVFLIWDSITYLQLTISIQQVPQTTMCETLKPIFIAVVLALMIGSVAAVAAVPTDHNLFEGNGLSYLCEVAGHQYGEIFQIYSKFHDIVWLFLLPLLALQIVSLHSSKVFGCTNEKVTQSIKNCEDEDLVKELKSQQRWLFTVKLLVFTYVACLIPITVFKLLVALFEQNYLFHYVFPFSVGIFLKRLALIIQSLLVITSPIILIVRHGCRKITTLHSGIEITAL